MTTVTILYLISTGWFGGQTANEMLRFPNMEACQAARAAFAVGHPSPQRMKCITDILVDSKVVRGIQ